VSQKKSLSHILIVSVAISVAILLIQPNAISQILILLFLTLATAYSAPPIRAKAHAIIDSTSNIFYVFPAFIAYTQLTNQLPPTPIIIAACLWPIAMHLYSAIPDITADTKAKLKTSAIVFGFNGSLIICAILWLTTLLLALQYGPQFFILGIYPILPLLLINKKEKDADKLYWYFPIINTIVGFLLCIYAIVI
jgi:4-hydroxybenzoate polyprenyltransferase